MAAHGVDDLGRRPEPLGNGIESVGLSRRGRSSSAVDRVKVGDMVCLPFNIGCGFCKNCEAGLTGFCLTANPGNARAAYGYADMGPQAMGTGQANVKEYNRQLRNLIHRDKLHPGLIVSHELNLDQAADGYQHFDDREDGWTKVILHP
jgi:threonine dehydrogenase-like Zn-dependent dehydrogenase